ncbi:hypothetical protein C1645_830114 [Glomus cerebriforme]|uniref:Sel1 repeat protein n=1 Tax=Glomus cerebriforme TaxID=658196 RepID=A0A397SPB8_9GLOM|nr:hypothetical protein C1645_830114 [Glomus cerebriforme]
MCSNELDKVCHWYHKAAENDNKVALYKLGEFYELGQGVYIDKENRGKRVQKDVDSAIYWYKKVVENGCQEFEEKLSALLNQQKRFVSFLSVKILFR